MKAKKLNAILATVLSVALLCLFVFPVLDADIEIPTKPEYTMSIDKFRAIGSVEGSTGKGPGAEIVGTDPSNFIWTADEIIWLGIAITKDATTTVEFPIDSNGIELMEMALDYDGEYLTPYINIEAELTADEITALAGATDEAKWAAIIKKYNIGTEGGWDAGYEIISNEIVDITGERENPLPDNINKMAHLTIAKKTETDLVNPKLQGMNAGVKQYLFKLPFVINALPSAGEKPEVLKLTREPNYLSMKDLGTFESSWMRTDPESGEKSKNLSNWIKYAGDPSIFGMQTVVEIDPSSPLGGIINDPNMSEAEKNKAEDIFKNENIINQGKPDEKYYNPAAWDDTATVDKINYDHDPKTIVTKIDIDTNLQTLAESKKPAKAYDSANTEVDTNSIATVIKDINGKPAILDNIDPIANMGVYTIEYRKGTAEGEVLATRPLVVLVELGDIDMKSGITQEDATAVYNINKTGSTYTGKYENLYKYRVADINQDGVLNSIDANHIQAQIDYIDKSHDIKQFYTMTGGGQQ